MEQRIFTLDEANAMLPQLKEDLSALQVLTRQYEERYAELQKKKAAFKLSSNSLENGGDPFFAEEGRIEFMRIEIDLFIENFSRKGVLLKMINPGLIDFPAVANGENVLICWKEGEEHVSHYHGWHDGFIGRKPFPEA